MTLTSKILRGVAAGMMLVVAGGNCWAEGLSLEKARERLEEVSDALLASGSAVDAAKAERAALHKVNLPTVSFTAMQVWGYKTLSLMGRDVSDDFNGPRYMVDFMWPLYTGGKMDAARRALDARVDVSKATMAERKEQLEVLLVQVYYGAGLAGRTLVLREAMLEQAERQLKRAERFRQTGQIAEIERMTAQVARDEAARAAVLARREKEIADAGLRRLLKLPDGAVEVTSPLFVDMKPLEPLGDWLSRTNANNGSVEVVRAMKRAAAEGVSMEKASWMPEVFGAGLYNIDKHYLSSIEPDYLVSVGVRLKLFSTTDRRSKVRAATAKRQEAEYMQAAQLQAALQKTEASWRRVEAAREQFELIESMLKLAKENVRLKERSFEEGLATSLDVSEAANALTRAELAQAEAAYQYDVALAELLASAGEAKRFGEFAGSKNAKLILKK